MRASAPKLLRQVLPSMKQSVALNDGVQCAARVLPYGDIAGLEVTAGLCVRVHS